MLYGFYISHGDLEKAFVLHVFKFKCSFNAMQISSMQCNAAEMHVKMQTDCIGFEHADLRNTMFYRNLQVKKCSLLKSADSVDSFLISRGTSHRMTALLVSLSDGVKIIQLPSKPLLLSCTDEIQLRHFQATQALGIAGIR